MTDIGKLLEQLAAFRRERHIALLALDPVQLLAVYEKYDEPHVAAGVRERWVKYGDEFMLTIMHKTRAALSDLPADVRQESIDWLRAHGYTVRTVKELTEIGSRRRSRI